MYSSGIFAPGTLEGRLAWDAYLGEVPGQSLYSGSGRFAKGNCLVWLGTRTFFQANIRRDRRGGPKRNWQT